MSDLRSDAHHRLTIWLASCTRRGGLSRNTLAIGIVVLDHLMNGVVDTHEVISDGGEIVGSRSRLGKTLQKHGVSEPAKFLKEVTTRQAHQDGRRLFETYDYGRFFQFLDRERAQGLIRDLIAVLIDHVNQWFDRQRLPFDFDSQHSPTEWIRVILELAQNRSSGIVEQHLVGAKLQRRHPTMPISNFPSHAADVQTGREGDFVIGRTVYHVTAAPNPNLVKKCGENIRNGLYPIILVPSQHVLRVRSFAAYENIEQRLSVLAIEDFVALNLVELANETNTSFIAMLRSILELYNQRVEAVETDMSLQFDL
jgi:hypothetical protein